MTARWSTTPGDVSSVCEAVPHAPRRAHTPSHRPLLAGVFPRRADSLDSRAARAGDVALAATLTLTELGPIFSANLVGQCVGLVIFPLIAGRIGQRAVVLVSLIGFGIAQSASALADDATGTRRVAPHHRRISRRSTSQLPRPRDRCRPACETRSRHHDAVHGIRPWRDRCRPRRDGLHECRRLAHGDDCRGRGVCRHCDRRLHLVREPVSQQDDATGTPAPPRRATSVCCRRAISSARCCSGSCSSC